jgi:hypothetical protein
VKWNIWRFEENKDERGIGEDVSGGFGVIGDDKEVSLTGMVG